MKALKKRIALILTVIMITVSFASCGINSEKEKAIQMREYLYSGFIEEDDAEKAYQLFNSFFQNSDENIDLFFKTYYNSIFEEPNPKRVKKQILLLYEASLLCTERYSEFENSLLNEKYAELHSDFYDIWDSALALNYLSQNLDHAAIENVFLNIAEQSEDLKLNAYTFIYYLNLYFEQENSEEVSSLVLQSKDYEKRRYMHTVGFLLANRYDDYKRLFVKEYVNHPFTGIDLIFLMENTKLSNNQIQALNESYDLLKEAYANHTEHSEDVKSQKVLLVEKLQKILLGEM